MAMPLYELSKEAIEITEYLSGAPKTIQISGRTNSVGVRGNILSIRERYRDTNDLEDACKAISDKGRD